MKKTVVLALCITIVFTIGGCSKIKKDQPSDRTNKFMNTKQLMDLNDKGVYCGYKYDNSTEISESVTAKYSLGELQRYFQSTFSYEKSYFKEIELSSDGKDLIDSVNNVFKIECLRKSLYNYYTVYKVKEGGHYFVFWQHANSKDYVVNSFYIPNVKSLEEFKSIKEGKSTFEDIKKIDPAVELNTRLSSGIFSYCLLDTGEVLSVKYDLYRLQDLINKNKKITKKDLVVETKEVMQREKTDFLEQILNKDLPY